MTVFSSSDVLFNPPEATVWSTVTGGFARHVLVVALRERDAAEGTLFLEKVLGAAGLILENDAALAWVGHDEPLGLFPLPDNRRPQTVVAFGCPPGRLGLRIDVAPYQPTAFYGMQWLFADALSTLQPDKARKTRLWQALQQLFLF